MPGLTASLAAGTPVDLRDAVTGLASRNARPAARPCCMPAGTGTSREARGVSPATRPRPW
jgi:hypothetical protein